MTDEAKGRIDVDYPAGCEVCNERDVPVAALYRAGPLYPQIRVCVDCLWDARNLVMSYVKRRVLVEEVSVIGLAVREELNRG